MNEEWNNLSHEEKNVQLYINQKELLEQFLKTGAISKAQYEKSLGDLTEKMGMEKITNNCFTKNTYINIR